jgi:hypothetical protein
MNRRTFALALAVLAVTPPVLAQRVRVIDIDVHLNPT